MKNEKQVKDGLVVGAETCYSACPYASPFQGLREKLSHTFFSAITFQMSAK